MPRVTIAFMARSSSAREAYVALLRGINVGGKNVIPMASLVKTFERLGFSRVQTLLASGNVIFAAPRQDARKLERTIEKALASELGYDGKVVVRSKREMDALVKRLPKDWAKPSPAVRYYVLFLRHAVDHERVLGQFQPKPGVETLAYAPGALLWAAKKNALTRSAVSRQVLAGPLYQEMTSRNLATTTKIVELMAKVSSADRAS